ncbi:MAG: TIGR01459 family HAD-type hydrolase [Hyphomicrobium sp.]
MTTKRVPPIITAAGPLLARYDVVFSDVWGVVHDGHKAFTSACDALVRFRAGGGTVILVSNAPVPKERVARMLDLRAVPRTAWDDIVSSGGIALDHVKERGYARIYSIGPKDRDAAFFERLAASTVDLAEAEAIVCTGLVDDTTETAETYRPLLERALLRRLPFVCANPDLVVDVGGRLYPCAGALADLYEKLGGEVFWAGKPHPSAYGAAHKAAARIRSEEIASDRILAIGDAVRTDLAAAEGAGIDAIFVAAGIHRAEAMADGAIVPERLARLFTPESPPAIAAMAHLAW